MPGSALNRFQHQLQRIYELEIPHDVDDFLICDDELARRIDTSAGAREVQEKLLVRQQGANVDVALYIDKAIVERLEAADPTRFLHRGNLADFWIAVEGVSHFLYLTYNAGFERGVSLLELELQAEVDRYISSAFLFGRQGGGRVPSRLIAWLFDDPSFDRNLEQEALDRYRKANHYAGLYCRYLQDHYLSKRANGGMINELRRFYRLTQRAKIDRIESAA